MDFGDVLDEWERIKREHKDSSPPQEAEKAAERKSPPRKTGPGDAATGALVAWLAANPVGDKDAESDAGPAPSRRDQDLESRRLSGLKPQAVLDLHGMTAEEAGEAIASFVADASRAGLEKVLLIHGKGLHSAGSPVLKKAARRALEANPLAGRFGEADRADGGSGALWVLIRKRGQ